MNPDLVPAPDMLGLPMAAPVLHVLMSATLAVHWMLVGGALGGVVILLAEGVRRRTDGPGAAAVGRALVPWLVFALSMGVTFGIAPLLFVQVLYGNLFYSANILQAFWWLAIVPLVVAAHYLLYHARRRTYAGGPAPAWALAAAAACLAVLATILVSNTLLSQEPEAWPRMYSTYGGAGLYAAAPALPVRWTFALLGLLTAGGVVAALVGNVTRREDARVGPAVTARGLALARWTLPLQVVAGAVGLMAMPGDRRAALLMRWEVWAFFTAAVATAVLLRTAAGPSARPAHTTGAAAVYLAGLFILALLRDAARQEAVSPYLQLADVPVNPQWGPFVMFLVFFVAGAGAVAWGIRAARAGQAT
jgi:hypothetical protein